MSKPVIPDKFEQGIIYAACLLSEMYDQPTMAASILEQAGLEKIDCSGLDDHEKRELAKLRNEKNMDFRGLS